MNVVNIHKRILNQPKFKVSELLETLSGKNDKIMPTEKWPPMILNLGLKVGSKGGHGPIGYTLTKYISGELVQFEFSKPKGFSGIHKFEISEMENGKTEIKHVIEMETSGIGTIQWVLAIRWLHNALVEDALDKVENNFTLTIKITAWSFWVKVLRMLLSLKK